MKPILIFLLVAVGVWFVWHVLFVIGWAPNYSEGERTGDVYKFSRKGLDELEGIIHTKHLFDL